MRLARLLPRTAFAVVATATAAIAMPTPLQTAMSDPAQAMAGGIVGRGRVEARDGLVVLAGPVGGGTLARLAVAEGDRLGVGDVVAELQDRALRAAAAVAAERDLDVARAEFARVTAPAKQSEIDMERARLVLEELMLQERGRMRCGPSSCSGAASSPPPPTRRSPVRWCARRARGSTPRPALPLSPRCAPSTRRLRGPPWR
jgi:HlyD family secretion protein